ncbi:MAG: hypothetical protein HOW73_32585 [Polyangiaceae bacterium]|nr:hypothetical protein [Polyangiaceae bacterium]
MLRAALASLASICVGCSFFTPFPDVELQGGGGSSSGGGGAGAEGGGPACDVETECSNCPSEMCPAPDDPIELSVDASALAENPDSALTIIDGLVAEDILFIGTFRQAVTLTVPGRSGVTGLTTQTGFIFRPFNADVITPVTNCGSDDQPFSSGEVFFTSMSDAGDQYVVAGAFEGDYLRFSDTSQPMCGTGGSIVSAPAGNGEKFAPFIAFARDNNTGIEGALTAINAARGNENGYISDVAALDSSQHRVVAVGMAKQDPFAQSSDFDGSTALYYVLAADGPSLDDMVVLNRRICSANDFDQGVLGGLRSSITVDGDGVVWVAGTGCEPDDSDGDHSFIERIPTLGLTTFDEKSSIDLGTDEAPVGVTKISANDARVFVAGTYSGEPFAETPGAETGTDDGFVMAFERDSWDQGAAWVTRIASTGKPEIGALLSAGDKVFVTGTIVGDGGISPSLACFTSDEPTKGRAFLAALDAATGDLQWLRFDGFDAGSPTENAFARGTALAAGGADVFSAMSIHGQLEMSCGGATTNPSNRPEAWIRPYLGIVR